MPEYVKNLLFEAEHCWLWQDAAVLSVCAVARVAGGGHHAGVATLPRSQERADLARLAPHGQPAGDRRSSRHRCAFARSLHSINASCEQVCDTHWIASGLTSGEVTLFDERTGIILSQWRAHESQVLKVRLLIWRQRSAVLDPRQIVPYGSHFVLTSGADKTICLWDVRCVAEQRSLGHRALLLFSGSEPYLHQKFTGLPDSVKRSLSVAVSCSNLLALAQSGTASSGLCVCGWQQDRLGLVEEGEKRCRCSSVQMGLQASQKHVSKLSVTALKGHKTKSNLSALAILPSYRFLLMGTEDGRVLVSG